MAEKPCSKTSVTVIRLCGVQGCCPTVKIYHKSGRIVIIDDDGGKVALSKEQWQEALTKVKLNA